MHFLHWVLQSAEENNASSHPVSPEAVLETPCWTQRVWRKAEECSERQQECHTLHASFLCRALFKHSLHRQSCSYPTTAMPVRKRQHLMATPNIAWVKQNTGQEADQAAAENCSGTKWCGSTDENPQIVRWVAKPCLSGLVKFTFKWLFYSLMPSVKFLYPVEVLLQRNWNVTICSNLDCSFSFISITIIMSSFP